MKPFKSKDTEKGDHSSVEVYADSDQKYLEIKMDGSSDYMFIHSTPHITRKDDEIQGSARLTSRSSYSIDSGFSDRTFNSTWVSSMKDTPLSLSEQFSPQLEGGSSRRQTLKACEFSPINRGHSSNIPSRKLEFSASYLQPTLFHLSQTEPCVRETVGDSAESVKYEEVDNLSTIEAESVLPSKPSALIFNNQSPSRSSSLHSVITDDLEVSLQEMALEESPVSSRTSPVNVNSPTCDKDDVDEEKDDVDEEKDDVDEKKEILQQLCASNEEIKTLLQFGKCYRHLSDSCLDKLVVQTRLLQTSHTRPHFISSLYKSSSFNGYVTPDLLSSEMLHHRAEPKLKSLNELSLTPNSSAESQRPTSTISTSNLTSKAKSDYDLPACKVVYDNNSTTKSDCLPVFSNFRVPPLPHMHTSSQSTTNQHCKCHFVTTHKIDNGEHITFNFPLNILHRSPIKRSCDFEDDRGLLFSPTKVRKTEMISDTFTRDERKSVITSPEKNATRKILNDGGEYSPSIGRGMSTVCEQVYSTHPYLYTWIPTAANGTSRKILDGIDTVYDEKLIENTDYISRLYSTTNKNILGNKEISAVENLLKVIEKFTPPEPTRLIGRNVGVRKFDIVQELYCQNFQLCLGKIFQYVANTDLITVARVSTIWKLAMCNDQKAYNRYRQHMKNLSRSSVHHGSGKENCGEKTVDAPSDYSLTQSRGLLSSMQSQAKRRVVPDPPSTAHVKDRIMSDDTLRICPHCQGPALVKHRQDRATCMSEKCSYDFCTLCFSSFHHPRPCKPLCKAPSKGDVAGTRKSKKNLKRL